MLSKNMYILPLREENILGIRYNSPAHKIFNRHEKIYNLCRAVDFLCKQGSEIRAALAGKVLKTYNSVTKNWNKDLEPPVDVMSKEDQDGNYVVLQHENGELSIYSHLQKDTIEVKEGDFVDKNHILGLSGHTGWSKLPHLHFMVHDFPPENKGGFRSLAPRWEINAKKIVNKKSNE